MCRAPEAAENGLRLDALGNLISIAVLSVYLNTNVVGTLKTTKLYDRTADTITVDEIERIVI